MLELAGGANEGGFHDITTPFPTTKGGHAWNLHRRLAFRFCTGAASAPQAPPVSVLARQRRDRASLPERREGARLREVFCVPRELVMRMFERGYRQSAITKVRASGQIGKSQYGVFKDGAVVIETPKGVHRFNNLQELVWQAKSPSSVKNRRSLEMDSQEAVAFGPPLPVSATPKSRFDFTTMSPHRFPLPWQVKQIPDGLAEIR